jgi:DNA-directed RNA polymerase subunit RPC12/RpoP
MSKGYKCMECGYEILVGDYTRTIDGRSCNKCGGHRLRAECNENNIKKDVKLERSRLSVITIDVSIKGYDKAKQQLRNLEDTFDRILEKQERVGRIVNNTRHKAIKIMIDGKVYDVEPDSPSNNKINIEELAMELEHYRKQQMFMIDGKGNGY